MDSFAYISRLNWKWGLFYLYDEHNDVSWYPYDTQLRVHEPGRGDLLVRIKRDSQ